MGSRRPHVMSRQLPRKAAVACTVIFVPLLSAGSEDQSYPNFKFWGIVRAQLTGKTQLLRIGSYFQIERVHPVLPALRISRRVLVQ